MSGACVAAFLGCIGIAGGEGQPLLGGSTTRFRGNGYALRAIVPIDRLPDKIRFKPGDVSLVPDTSDHQDEYMVVYLVNDTDQPLPRIIGELHKVHGQVKFGAHWFARVPIQPVCGTVPPPKDLPPRSALALGALRSGRGDSDGEIRYFFSTGGEVVFSEPMRGRYFSADLATVMDQSTHSGILGDEFDNGWNKGRWAENRVARNAEEFVALLELSRHHRLCLAQRRSLQDWIGRQKRKAGHSDPEAGKAIRQMEAILWRPWLINEGSQTLVDRCSTALETKTPGDFGSPERCKAAVWRYLVWATPETWPSGWKPDDVDPTSKAKIVTLAKAALNGPIPGESDAAAEFLAKRTSDDGQFPSEEFLHFLESSSVRVVEAGLAGLVKRGKADEAGPWMLRQLERGLPELCRYYGAIRYGLRGEISDWEITFISRQLESNPLEILFILSSQPRGEAGSEWAVACEVPLRMAILALLEPEARSRWPGETETTKPDFRSPEQGFNQGLSHGLRMLDRLNRPEDTPIFHDFLDHPAASLNAYTDGSSTLFYPVRMAAQQALKARKIAIPDGVVTEIKFNAPAPQDHHERLAGWHPTALLYCMLVAAVLVVRSFVRRTRTRALEVLES